MSRFRYDFIDTVVPWLATGDGELVQYTHGRIFDLFLERVRQSALSRFPYSTPNIESLGLIGSSLGFQRGSSEFDGGYAARISEWLQPWSQRSKCGYYALLRQLALVLGLPTGARVKAVTRNGFWVSYVDDVITYGSLTSAVTGDNNGFWVGTGEAPDIESGWGRAYIVIENHPGWFLPTALTVGAPGLWGDAIGSTDEVIGLGGAKASEVADLRGLIREWLALGIEPVELLYNADPAQPYPETGVDMGTAGLPNYLAVVPTNLVRIPL